MAICAVCATENRAGRKFCAQCGSPLARTCPACGSAAEEADRFCGECGTPLVDVRASADVAPQVPPPPAAERRTVTVMFVDLVGFTSLSEVRDSEEVRDLLSRYFDSARQIVERYAGVVEKFIGDAVMAVWGAPVSHEDDAERAVRAALDLVGGVDALGTEVGVPHLQARGGVLTGEATVTMDAAHQGMVAGDLVNTASRIQSAAGPGTVLVGESTHHATDSAVAYEEAGLHELKGKTEPVALWRAIRVVAGRGGSIRTPGLEAPFVGREAEFRLLKELFHTSAQERKAHLVSVVGLAGVGKTRLSWELEKYVDGLASTTAWHRGRCLAYGDGVTYWALAEMVRMRARIVEGEDPASARTKLAAVLDEFVPDPEERRWTESRLAHLLGLDEPVAVDRPELFSAWRLFLERISERYSTVMVFEDLQWADAALLDFIEYLLEWSRDRPLFILTLARPELAERRSNWGAGKRNFTSLYLEPLRVPAMKQLLAGLAPGLSEELTERVLERAEGIPLYAVETVRMLLDRGFLRREGAEYRPTGPVEDLEVPATLMALIAARLDGIPADERRLLQDASVLGKSFTRDGLLSVTDLGGDRLDGLLDSLSRKEFVTLQADPRSPERGQYTFLQDLVNRVAYETLSKRERKAKHLAVAAYLRSVMQSEDDELVEVVASHLVNAFRLVPDAPGAEAIKQEAVSALTKAGQRAASLAASDDARGYFMRAAELVDDAVHRAELLERAGEMGWAGGAVAEAEALFEEAILLLEGANRLHPVARVEARLAEILWDTGRIEQAVERMEGAFDVLSRDPPDADLAVLAAQLGRFRVFTGAMARAGPPLELALEIAERLWLPEVISQALNTKSLMFDAAGRREESLALLEHALTVALDNDAPNAAFRAYFNLHHLMLVRDRYAQASEYEEQALALARRLGYRGWELNFLAATGSTLYVTGHWDQALERLTAGYAVQGQTNLIGLSRSLPPYIRMRVARGETEEARSHLERVEDALRSGGTFELTDRAVGRAIFLLATGDPAGALDAATDALSAVQTIGFAHENLREVVPEAVEAAIHLGHLERADEILSGIEGRPATQVSQFEGAQVARLRARLAAIQGDPAGVAPRLKSAAGIWRETGVPFWLAVTLLEHAEWLRTHGDTDSEAAASLLAETREIFEHLGAGPWLERVARAEEGLVVPTREP